MKKSILIIALLACLVSCKKVTKIDSDTKAAITYFKDDRTGLCFASVNVESNTQGGTVTSTSITNVPCDSVKNYLD